MRRDLPVARIAPRRAPSSSTRRRAIQPPIACTTTEPAKSWNSGAEARLQPGLDAEALVPRDALEEGIDERPSRKVAASCGWKRRALGDAAEMMAGIAAAKVRGRRSA